MKNQGAKKRRTEEDGSTDMDRISELPQPILHHILSFLSQQKAVQTCVLSKSWRYLGSTRPNLEFREQWLKGNKKKFLSVLDNTLQRYHDQNLSIQQLNLEMMMSGNCPKLTSLLRKWFPISMLGVKTFTGEKLYLDMTSVLFHAKSLQELELTRCKLNFDKNSPCVLSNLRKLDLRFVRISKKTLKHILSSCPLIEFLDLNRCGLLRTINLSKAHTLKHFGFRAYSEIYAIHVPTTLESIHSAGSPYNWFYHPENTYFPHLKTLHLLWVNLSAKSFDKFSSKYCPCLENLKISGCEDLKGFQLSSRSITRLEIIMREKIKGIEAAIDAPNIRYFRFSSSFVPSISFTKTSSEWESHISVNDQKQNDAIRFNQDLNELLKALIPSRVHLELRPPQGIRRFLRNRLKWR